MSEVPQGKQEGLGKAHKTSGSSNTAPAMPLTYIEVSDDFDGRTFRVHISHADYRQATFTELDRMLFDDVEHGEPSDTPLADKLLALETLMRRVEEGKRKVTT